jgi:hypothetical protein
VSSSPRLDNTTGDQSRFEAPLGAWSDHWEDVETVAAIRDSADVPLGGTAQGAGASLRHLGRVVRQCLQRHSIRRPGAGYWAIKAAGQTGQKTPRSARVRR